MEIGRTQNVNQFKNITSQKGVRKDPQGINVNDTFSHTAANDPTADLRKAAEVLLNKAEPVTPEKLWAVEQSGGIMVSSKGELFANRSQYKRLTKMSRETGKDIWSLDTGGEVYRKPVEGPDGTIYTVNNKGKLLAVNPDSGKLEWEFQGKSSGGYAPSFDKNGDIYFHTGGRMVVIDGKTHAKKQEFEIAVGSEDKAAVSSDGMVYLGNQKGILYGFDSKDGKLKWEHKGSGLIRSSPAVGPDGTVYTGTTDNEFYAVNGKTGERKWMFKAKHYMLYPPMVDKDGTVFAGSSDHNLYAFDPNTGKPKWTFDCGAEIRQTPVVGPDNNIYFVSDRNVAFCLDKNSGKKKWEFKANSYVHMSPSIDDKGNFYFGCNDNKIYAFKDRATKSDVDRQEKIKQGVSPDGEKPEIKDEETFVEIGGVKLEKRGK